MTDRPCGDCSVCCTHKPINSEELTKAPGVTCEHCRSPGCGIYESRPQVCRAYRCAWKSVAWLPEAMRPDRSGVLIDFREIDAPGYELEATLLAYRDGAAFERNPVPDVIASLIENGVRVVIARSGPPGTLDAQAPANEALGEAVRARDGARFLEQLKAGVRALGKTGWAPYRADEPG
jgi:hypothetical protein